MMFQFHRAILFFIEFILILCSVSATEFVYNRNFNSSNINLYGNATIQDSILTLTNQTYFSIGRAFYPFKVPMKKKGSNTPLPFATSFIFSIAPIKNFPTAHGFALLFSPATAIGGALSGNYLGLFNRSTEGNFSDHVFAIEFDDFRNEEFKEQNDNHVGVDVNSMESISSEPAGFWEGETMEHLRLCSGQNYQVWVDFEGFEINVTMAPAGHRKPQRALISTSVNLSEVFVDEMYVGFSGATGKMVDQCRILAWSFSNSNLSIGYALHTKHLPLFVHPRGVLYRSKVFIFGVTFGVLFVCGCFVFVFVYLSRTRRRGREEKFEDWELDYWPHRIRYEEIFAATDGFAEEKVIGNGTSGKVYKGVLKGAVVAVKRIIDSDAHGVREFLAEISSLGRMKHRNLVGFRGWSKSKGGKLILVYDYMGNESLDKRIFECEEDSMLMSWELRINVLQNVASGILYLHEGWEVEVLHRDIKSSNVLLDKDMNARLGDFGLARLHHKENVADTTRVIGTLGYMAPELLRIGRPSTATDVYSFGILVLEVVCGRRPVVADKPLLSDWVLSLMTKGELSSAIDHRLKDQAGFSANEAERVLHLGLLCASSDPGARPTMRQVVKVLEGIGGSECSVDGMQMSLLGKINSAASWSRSSTSFANINYPTFDEILQTKFYSTASMSVSYPSQQSDSDVLSEGR